MDRKTKIVTHSMLLAAFLSLVVVDNFSTTSYYSSSTTTTTIGEAIEGFPASIHQQQQQQPTFVELSPKEISSLGGAPKPYCEQSRLNDERPTGRCCLGASSDGADQSLQNKEGGCHSKNATVYLRVQEYAKEDLRLYPVRFNESGSHNSSESHLNCDVCRIVQIVASMKHRRFAFAGDSIQTQVFTGFECELRRRNFNVTTTASPPVLWPEEQKPCGKPAWRYGVKETTCIRVTVPEWIESLNPSEQNPSTNHVEFCHYRHYRPCPEMEDHKIIRESNDVVMFNYGVHFLRTELAAFKESLGALLRTYNDSDSLLMYREAAAQHFDSDGGDFVGKDNNTTCVPMNKTGRRKKWRTGFFNVQAMRNGFSVVDSFQNREKHADPRQRDREVALIRFWDFTSELHSLKLKEVDCTHFCYTPHIYYSLWRHIRIALDGYVRK